VLVINTITDFYSLSEYYRVAILKALDTKTRLIDWLDKQGRAPVRWHKHATTSQCRECGGSGVQVRVPRDSSDIHPSQITRCLKKLWYDCSLTPEIDKDGDPIPYYVYSESYTNPYEQINFDQGTGIHIQFQGYGLRGAWGNNYGIELKIDPDSKDLPIAEAYWIKGAVDALLNPYEIMVPEIGPVAIRVIHEYKSMNDNSYTNAKSPKPDHKWQASIYARIFDAPIVVYLYVNKDNNKLADFPVPFDFQLWEYIEKKIERVQYYVNRRQLPVWEETSAVHKPKECEKCPYLRICDPPQDIKRR